MGELTSGVYATKGVAVGRSTCGMPASPSPKVAKMPTRHPYRYSADPMLNSGLKPGLDIEADKATSEEEKDASYRIELNRPVPSYAGKATRAPLSRAHTPTKSEQTR